MSLFVESNVDADTAELSTESYRKLSTMAVVSCALGVLSVVAVLDWMLFVVPILGLTAGLMAWFRIRAFPEDFSGRGVALFGMLSSLSLLAAGAARLSYVYATEVPEGYARISYAELQPPPEAPSDAVPTSAKKLEGKQVFIKGYVLPTANGETEGIKEFTLVRDRGDCCFGGNPKLTDKVRIHLQGALELKFSTRIFRLAGTFHMRKDGDTLTIYSLDADHLE